MRVVADGGEIDRAAVWSKTDLAVQLVATGAELWLSAGAGTLVRFVADSNGEFGEEPLAVVRAVLDGHATEFLQSTADDPRVLRVAGWRVDTDFGTFAGGIGQDDATAVLPILEPFGHLA